MQACANMSIYLCIYLCVTGGQILTCVYHIYIYICVCVYIYIYKVLFLMFVFIYLFIYLCTPDWHTCFLNITIYCHPDLHINKDKVLWPEPWHLLLSCCAFWWKSWHGIQPAATAPGAFHPLILCHRSSAPPGELIDRELIDSTLYCMMNLCWISILYYVMHGAAVIPLLMSSFLLLYHTTICSVSCTTGGGGGGGGGGGNAFCTATTSFSACGQHQCKTENMNH